MIVGTVKEVLKNEDRIGLSPDSIREYVNNGHTVLVETNCGLASGFSDDDYIKSGAIIKQSAQEVWESSDMIVKVKEPQEAEYKYFRKDLIIYTFFHLAADEALTKALIKFKTTAIAYETIELEDGSLPCLKPMSEIAGRLSVLEGSNYLQSNFGGKGVLISSVPGVKRVNVVIIGAGNVGKNALRMAVGLNAVVTIIDKDLGKLTEIDHLYNGQVTTLYSTSQNIFNSLKTADLVISSVLLKGAKAPKLIKNEYYQHMEKGTVIVDVAIDQGGSTESSRRTYHSDPIYQVDGIIHYCVGNMPGAVPKTATIALNNTTLMYGLEIANKGMDISKLSEPLLKGINVFDGEITYQAVADAFDLKYKKLKLN